MINESTVGLREGFYGDGDRGTCVIHGEEQLMVGQPPRDIIESTLVSLGFCRDGAISGSRQLLGKGCKMLPLTINAPLGIFLLPTRAYDRPDCFWLSLMHIQETERLNKDGTRVFTSFGHKIDLEIKQSLFIRKMDKARRLRELVTRNAQQSFCFSREQKQGLTIVEKKGEYRMEE
ncbi:competence protein ComK [Neobacillus sp. YIM B06451]|uniref:competence protein ComK n=1 Tax=Neobacillus sp. YIM B06451 TaxID=3070994 RepID=UPI00293063B0|nr:competence protein ComK [Neobacillus sp. YIM B06451]